MSFIINQHETLENAKQWLQVNGWEALMWGNFKL